MNLPPMMVQPDAVRVCAYYTDGQCTSIDVALNYEGITQEDIEATIEKLANSAPDGEVLVGGRRPEDLADLAQNSGRPDIAATQRIDIQDGKWRGRVQAPATPPPLWQER